MKIAIVDGYSTGAVLARRLSGLKVECIHVPSQSTSAFLERSFQPGDYTHCLEHISDPRQLADQLAAFGVSRVIAGAESGVTLAETLALELGLPANTADHLAARRDKAMMMQAAAEAGVATPLSATVTTAEQAADWAASSGLAEIVVKPRASAGTDNVWFCRTAEEVRSATAAILGSTDMFGGLNTTALVQERLIGQEYYLNSVSFNGVHRIAEIWHYTKHLAGTAPVYDFEEPVPGDHPQARALKEFACTVLDALGIHNSPAHTEIMLTERGPVLIETGARLGGGTIPDIIERHTLHSQTSLLAASLTEPETMRHFDDTAVRWRGALRNVHFLNHRNGPAAPASFDQIRTLPSALAVVPAAQAGDALTVTRDYLSSPGFAYLAADERSAVERDYLRLRGWEQRGIYTAPHLDELPGAA